MTAKEKLYEIYEKSLLEKSESMSVSDICRKADINRATFYKYFGSLEELETFVVRSYTRGLFEELMEGLAPETYTDFNDFAVRFLKAMEKQKKFVKFDIQRFVSTKWIGAAMDEYREVFASKIAGFPDREMRDLLVEQGTNAAMFWGLIILRDSEHFNSASDDILAEYAADAAKLADADIDPYEALPGDQLDIVLAMIDFAVHKGKSAASVSEICREAGVTRQGFYRFFSSMEECRKKCLWLIESYLIKFVSDRAFTDEIEPYRFKANMRFRPADGALSDLPKNLLFALIDSVGVIYNRCISACEKDADESTDRMLYFHLFFYIAAFVCMSARFFETSDEEEYLRDVKLLRKFRKSFPSLDSLIASLGEKLDGGKRGAKRPDSVKARLSEKYAEYLLEGDDKVQVAKICDDIGINRTTFYRSFRSLDALSNYAVRRYAKRFVDELSGDLRIRSFRDFDRFAENYVRLVEEHRKYAGSKVLKVIRNEWLCIFFEELKAGVESSLEMKFEDKEWFSSIIAYCMILWLYYFVLHSDNYDARRESLLDSYAESAVRIVERNIHPYEVVEPDKFDVITGFVNCSARFGRDPKSVSELCKFARISRQTFYRHYPNLESSRDDTVRFLKAFIEECLFLCAFRDDHDPPENRFLRTYAPEKDFIFFRHSRTYILAVNDALFNTYLKCVKFLEDEGFEDRAMYYHLFFFIVSYLISALNLLYDPGKSEEFRREMRLLEGYRKSFPPLDEMISNLNGNLDRIRNPGGKQDGKKG